ncbi:MAG: helix-turn-helix transcriptional regulator [Roseibium sp.]|nr:helix-turn-helix transcriptional regulator [Roseibium sp.]
MHDTRPMDFYPRSQIGLKIHFVKNDWRYTQHMETWNERFKRLRKEKFPTMRAFADASQLSYDVVNKYERGDIRNPRGETFEVMAKTLGVTASYLRYGERNDHADAPLLGEKSLDDGRKKEIIDNLSMLTGLDPELFDKKIMQTSWHLTETIDQQVFGGHCPPMDTAKINAVIYHGLKDLLKVP